MKLSQVAIATLVPIIWGLGFAVTKADLGDFPPMFLMSMRYGLAALVLIWFSKWPTGHFKKTFWVAIVSGAIPYGLVFSGLKDLYASTAILIIQLQIPFMAILGVLVLKEALRLRQIIGMTLAFGGVVLITGEPQISANPWPVFLVVLGGLIWAYGQIMIRQIGRYVTGMQLITWVAVFCAPQLLVASFIFEDGQLDALAAAGPRAWGVVLYVGLIMTALAYSFWYRLLAQCEITKVAPFILLNPVSTVFFSILLLDEALTPWIAAGGVIVLVGIAIMTLERRRPTVKPPHRVGAE